MWNSAEIGASLFFIVLSVAQVVISFIVFSYASYSFLETLVGTASGDDEIIWAGDPLADWIWKFWYLLWIVGIWSVPIYFLLGFHGLKPLWFIAALVALLWVVFPVSLLSSLSGSSRLLIFRPSILRSILKHSLALVIFYLVTGTFVVVTGAAGYLALFGEMILWVPVAALCSATAVLLYGRLLGRMALLISLTPSTGSGGDAEEEPPADDASQTSSKADGSAPAAAPSPPVAHVPMAALAPEVSSQSAPPLESVVHAKTPSATVPPPEAKAEIYAVAPAQPSLPVSLPDHGPPPRPEQSDEDYDPAVSYEAAPPPKHPLWQGVYSFPFYKTTLGTLLILTFGFLTVLGLFRALVSVFPFRDPTG